MSACRYIDGHLDITRLSAPAEFADRTELIAAAAAPGAAGDDCAADFHARATDGGRNTVISRTQ